MLCDETEVLLVETSPDELLLMELLGEWPLVVKLFQGGTKVSYMFKFADVIGAVNRRASGELINSC